MLCNECAVTVPNQSVSKSIRHTDCTEKLQYWRNCHEYMNPLNTVERQVLSSITHHPGEGIRYSSTSPLSRSRAERSSALLLGHAFNLLCS